MKNLCFDIKKLFTRASAMILSTNQAIRVNYDTGFREL